ncbi:hypothetical protein RIR_jg24633.t1 [Rhizophagus irregularis DAOM 181602=DAOM 197198]|nr:hypothetical protein RIR_jg24633.t1 [Rhizophagus irregularis DAOM 181602=DAOM 197198]
MFLISFCKKGIRVRRNETHLVSVSIINVRVLKRMNNRIGHQNLEYKQVILNNLIMKIGRNTSNIFRK